MNYPASFCIFSFTLTFRRMNEHSHIFTCNLIKGKEFDRSWKQFTVKLGILPYQMKSLKHLYCKYENMQNIYFSIPHIFYCSGAVHRVCQAKTATFRTPDYYVTQDGCSPLLWNASLKSPLAWHTLWTVTYLKKFIQIGELIIEILTVKHAVW